METKRTLRTIKTIIALILIYVIMAIGCPLLWEMFLRLPGIWLNQNGPKMHLHDETITLIDKIMKEVGYALMIIVTGLGLLRPIFWYYFQR